MSAAAPGVVDAPVAGPPAYVPIYYNVTSSDGAKFRVEKKCLMMSVTLQNCAVNLLDDDVEEKEPIPLANVKGEDFKRVLAYMEHHKDDAPRAEGAEVELSDWDKEFLKMEHEELFELTCAANYLDIKVLMDATCKTIAMMIKGKSPEEMRQIWEIPSDEEEAAAAAAAKAKEEAEKKAREEAEAAGEGTSAATAEN